MSTTSSSVVTRNGNAAPAGALAIYADQVEWSPMQQAALNQLGLRNASDGDRMVFLHQAQRTGLDPFAKQIHMIEREGKWGIQTGIDGFRVIRSRAERKAGVRGVLSQALYIDAEGVEYKRWFKPMPPVGCEITYTVRELDGPETPYTSYLRFSEYAQYRKSDGKLAAKWSSSPAHMLEKCTEADVYRRAFPQDFAGIDLSDAPSAPDDDEPAQPTRQRVTAKQAQARNPQTVAATVVTPDASPAGEQPPPAAPVTPSGTPAGEVQINPDQAKAIWSCLNQDYGFASAEKDQARAAVAILVSRRPDQPPIASVNDLTSAEASRVLDQLHAWVEEGKQTGERPRDILAADIASRDADPREEADGA